MLKPGLRHNFKNSALVCRQSIGPTGATPRVVIAVGTALMLSLL